MAKVHLIVNCYIYRQMTDKLHILITGASRGIGKAVVERLLDSDKVEHVYVLTRNTELFLTSSKLQVIGFDLESPNFSVLKKIQRIDVIVNNAGQLIHSPFEETSEDNWHNMLKVNFLGPVELLKWALPLLKESRSPQVINITSMGGFQGSVKFPGLSAYSASKAALNNLTEVLAEEWKDIGIRVNSLALGAVNTEMLASAFPGYEAPFDAEEMSDFIVDFILERSRFFNGKIIPVSSTTP